VEQQEEEEAAAAAEEAAAAGPGPPGATSEIPPQHQTAMTGNGNAATFPSTRAESILFYDIIVSLGREGEAWKEQEEEEEEKEGSCPLS